METTGVDESELLKATDASSIVVNENSARLIANGFVNLFEKQLDQVQHSLKEALSKQEKMDIELEQLNSEHALENRKDCQELFYMVKEYTDKLRFIKKRMMSMHQRVKHLKKRSENLLKYRDKELIHLRQKQLQEEDLIAKPSSTG